MANKIVLTDHAVERMWQRRIFGPMIQQTVDDSDGNFVEGDGDTQFYKVIGGREIHAIAKPLARNEWLIKTVWVEDEDDPHPVWKIAATILASLHNVRRKGR